ncbi:MAG: hypothetical protein DRQ89_13165 [Epsilonproteobacteria bacterium]|nr:MAG: hypothetical protein DRQ89_13165 [Campylobacterota bacterium]
MFGIDFGNTLVGNMLGVGSDADEQAEQTSKLSSEMAKDYWKRTKGVRNQVIGGLDDFMKGNFDPTASPMYASQKLAVEQQYQTALDNLLANLPSGGGMGENMASLEMGKAGSLVDMIGKIIQDEYNKAYGMAVGSPQQSFQGLGTSGNINAPLLGKQGQTMGAQYNALGNIL